MIEFSGEISRKAKQYITNELRKLAPIIVFFGMWWLVAMAIWLGYETNRWNDVYVGIAFIVVLYIVLTVGIIFIHNTKHNEGTYPILVRIEGEEIFTQSQKDEFYWFRRIDGVKKVIDTGEFYYLKFHFPFNRYCLCQKDLITQGTIEEFEEIFADRIVRKPLK